MDVMMENADMDHFVHGKNTTTISVVSPVFNEENNVQALNDSLTWVMNQITENYEIIYVNDGSVDDSINQLLNIADKDKHVTVAELETNSGQTSAIMAGIELSQGDIIVLIDSDGQNDPKDIPRLIDKINEGYDVVSGWRRNRQDKFFTKIIPSKLANWLISKITGVKLNDYGCSLKAYRSRVLKRIKLYGEMHRFIPVYASWQGAKICEIPVNHFARKNGSSNYGLSRVFKVLLDLTLIKFFDKYKTKPIYFFGKFSMILFLLSLLTASYALYLKFVKGISFILTPLPLLTSLLFISSIILICLGIMTDIINRTYFESQNIHPYHIKALHSKKLGCFSLDR